MKNLRTFLLAAILFFAATLAVLHVDRQGALMYGSSGGISGHLHDLLALGFVHFEEARQQVFIENSLDLH